ncbi:RAM signaling pathway protein-domain-containing protein [Elsinoe ampelina]|uniref:RAM signaling pathway protein-domain-containing protein n=1 Tax=Elsinoe ampelina TaxID=302913 RepID=A0A6A6G2V5_9PEZI|nr:RAM signaling pathway protein-domain-containing protein [Elsinoe ampelina]
MTSARDAIFQNTPSPETTTKMERGNGLSWSHRRTPDTTELIEHAKRALDESAKHHIHNQDIPQPGWSVTTGEALNLNDRGIRSLPLEIIELIKHRVERLALSRNKQIALPAEISICTRLYYLNIRKNGLTEFPETILNIPNLQFLDLTQNDLTSIPEDISRMQSLKFLALEYNNISRLPTSLGDMTSLTKLRIDNNPIQYPPPEELAENPDAQRRAGYDKPTYVCGQVKRFMRLEKERQRQRAESDMSESNLETPRPLRRTNTGRFPVRPSMGSVDNSDNDNAPMMGYRAPPIPQKSSARDSLAVQPLRRPGLAPLTMQGLANRSRSETVATGSQKLKRHGFVPSRKTSGPPSANSLLKDPNAMKPAHFRTASYANGANGAANHSGTMSPISAQAPRQWMSKSRLSSLPEDRRVSKITSPTIRSARLLVYSLDQLNRPVDDAIRILRGDSSFPSQAERMHVTATQNLKELDAQLHILTPMNERQSQESKDIRLILKRSRYCVQAYHQLVAELRVNARKLVLRGDPMYLRALMLQLHACLLEVRNACDIQEATLAPVPPVSRFSNVSAARSDRTVTPTQSKPNNKRSRGAKIIAGLREKSPGSASLQPPYSALASATSSRTTTMTSMSLATPKSTESFGPHSHRSPHRSRTSTMTSTASLQPPSQLPTPVLDVNEAAEFEKIYLTLRQACDVADQCLLGCRQDFFLRKEGAARSMSSSAARAWTGALNKCDALMNSLGALRSRLNSIKLNDPSIRKSRDFWLACDAVFSSWYDLASEMKVLSNAGLDISSIKPQMRPVQRAIKDASRHIGNCSMANRVMEDQRAKRLQNQGHAIPPTPLSAALGPAVQATVPSTPGLSGGMNSANGINGMNGVNGSGYGIYGHGHGGSHAHVVNNSTSSTGSVVAMNGGMGMVSPADMTYGYQYGKGQVNGHGPGYHGERERSDTVLSRYAGRDGIRGR